MKKYQIADFIFGIHMEESLEIPENFKKFVIDTDEEVQVEYFLEVVDKLPELDGECVSQRNNLKGSGIPPDEFYGNGRILWTI